tara:strand:- start:777 stop:1751 length:975 start_codon:yes stop_codon:yes gene_type:complete
MKYIKTLNEAKYTSAFQKMNKLVYNDQISGRKSLSKTLAEDLGFDPKKEYTEGVGFDSTSLYDVKSGKTIMEDALSGKYTYDEILANAKDWYKKNESVNEAAQLVDEETGKVVKLPYKTKDFRGDPMTVKGFTEPHKSSSSGRIQTDKGEYFPGVAGVKIIGHKFESAVYENAKSDAKEIFDELMDVNGEEIADMDSQEAMTILSRRGIRGGRANMIAKELLKMTSSIGESLTEAKKFKPGDKWSNDFDYDGMMKYALTVNHKTPIKTLTKLHDSATDVNYHTPFRGLGNAIDWITDDGVNSPEGKDFIKQFHKDIKNEIKTMK